MSEALMRLPTISPVRRASGGFHGGDEQHDVMVGSDEVELGHAEQERLGEAEGRSVTDFVKVHVAQRECDGAADDEAEQDGDGGEKPREQSLGWRR